MKVIDLSPENKELFSLCLEDWSSDIAEAGPTRLEWINKFEKRGFKAKLAVDDAGNIGGMIQYLPIKLSPAEGENLYFIQCIWVHGHKQGRGNFQKQGMGKALLASAEEDARNFGAKGIAAWGIWLPFWMKASWFKKYGYVKADRQGISVLLWKPFTDDAKPPKWLQKTGKLPELTPGKVTVTAFVNGWCAATNLLYERAKRASKEFGDKVVFNLVDTSEKSAMREWGISDSLFIDHKEVHTGPPLPYEKIRKLIEKRVNKLK